MTVGYAGDVASSNRIGMLKILFKWRGSIWKSVIVELFVFMLTYAAVAIVIRKLLSEDQLTKFIEIRSQLIECLSRIPLVFLLGFFVTVVFNRWVDIFKRIGFIDNIALCLACYIPDNSLETVQRKRNLIRYCVLSQALVFRDISIEVKREFPEIESLVDAGFMTKNELELYNEEQDTTKYWLPMQWAMSIAYDLRYKHGSISGDPALVNIIDRLRDFRTDLQTLCCYDWIPVPLSYPQIVYLVVRVYFFISIFARQGVDSDNINIHVPFMTIIEFLFITGWVKVAEALLNPFGEDDDDFECRYLLDRNLKKGFEIVKCPKGPGDDQEDNLNKYALVELKPVKQKSVSKKIMNPYKGSATMLKLEQTAQHMKNVAHSNFFSCDGNSNKVSPIENHFKDSINRIRKLSSSIVEMNEQGTHDLYDTASPHYPRSRTASIRLSSTEMESPKIDISKDFHSHPNTTLSKVTEESIEDDCPNQETNEKDNVKNLIFDEETPKEVNI
uniref:Bestrophin homolog n=1 Tax=Parastrongyloides trichosuri TaxID=131310 RepID=A0A0N4ZHU6_PARTI